MWRIETAFADGAGAIRLEAKRERLQIGEIKEQCAKAGAVPATATPQEAQAHSWKPEYNAGRILAAKRSFDLAIPHFEKAVALSGGGAGGARGVEAAMREKNDGLARTLGARASQYEAQAAKK